MSQPGPNPNPPPRGLLKFMINVAIVGFFAVGLVVAAGSFGLFGCWCTDGFVRPERTLPVVNVEANPVKPGDMPPLPSPPK
jgi:hypothetical protein